MSILLFPTCKSVTDVELQSVMLQLEKLFKRLQDRLIFVVMVFEYVLVWMGSEDLSPESCDSSWWLISLWLCSKGRSHLRSVTVTQRRYLPWKWLTVLQHSLSLSQCSSSHSRLARKLKTFAGLISLSTILVLLNFCGAIRGSIEMEVRG